MQRRKKIKKVVLLYITLTFGDLLLANITFFDFCCFRFVNHYVTVDICINCSFLHLSLIIARRVTVLFYSFSAAHLFRRSYP